MENQETLNKLAQDFLSRIKLPEKRAASSFIIATIGLVGSGRTTVAKRFAERIDGAVLLQANSARYLLKETGLPWGENVRQILKIAAGKILSDGYGVVFDGNASDENDQKNIKEIAEKTKAKIYYIRIMIDKDAAKKREERKYDDLSWISSFDNFRVNTTEKMVANVEERYELHRNLRSEDIPNLAGEIDNNGTMESLNQQVDSIIARIEEFI